MEEKCTVYRTADIIAKRWTLLIILSIYKAKGKKRYKEIKKDLERITPKILSARLKELEKEGLVKKEIDHSEVPIKTFYSLTSSGMDLINVIHNLKRWGLKWKFKNKSCEKTFCKDCEF